MYGSRGYTRVLMIGDSMSVGGFGEGMAEWLVAKFGRASVSMYAACGSSPEHWLRDEPDYQTHCGYREVTPRTNLLYDYVGGRRPLPMIAPKVEDLISILHPRVVIVQLGTNWMDAMSARDSTKFGRDSLSFHQRDPQRGRVRCARSSGSRRRTPRITRAECSRKSTT